jgi:hypothetical protein
MRLLASTLRFVLADVALPFASLLIFWLGVQVHIQAFPFAKGSGRREGKGRS